MQIIHNDRFTMVANTIRIELLEAGLAYLDSKWGQDRVCSPYSRLYYVISGEGKLRIPAVRPCADDRRAAEAASGLIREADQFPASVELFTLRPGFLYLIPNGLYYDYFCEDRLEKVYFHVNVRMQDGFDLFNGCKACYQLSVGQERIAAVKQLFQSKSQTDYIALQGELYSAAAAFVREAGVEEKMKRNYSELVLQLFSLLPKLPLSASVREIAGVLNVSESTLAKRFRRETGMSIGSYREQLIMGRARQRLASGEQSIGEISEELGFCDQFYFSRYFKERQDETPSSYKRRYKVT